MSGDNAPVTLNIDAEDARLLLWALRCTAFDLNKVDAGSGDGVTALRERVVAQLAEQGNPHLNTHVEREWRRFVREALAGVA